MVEYIPVFIFRSKEDTVATEEAKDFISSSDIDMAMKTPVQVVR